MIDDWGKLNENSNNLEHTYEHETRNTKYHSLYSSYLQVFNSTLSSQILIYGPHLGFTITVMLWRVHYEDSPWVCGTLSMVSEEGDI